MENWVMIVDFVLIAGMSLLFLLVLFLLKSNTGLSKKLISVFFINSIFFLLYYYAYLHRSRPLGAIAILFGNGSGFLLGPFLLFYIKSLIQPSKRILKPLGLHLIVFFAFWILVSLPVSLSMSFGFFDEYHNRYVKYADFLNLIENTYFLIYLIISLRFIRRIKEASEQAYSNVDSNNLSWVSYLIWGLIVIVILDSSFSIYETFYPIIPWNIGTIIAFAFIVLNCILAYKGMFQARILLPDFLSEKNSAVTLSSGIVKDRPVKQLDSFSNEEIEKLKISLKQLLQYKKPYLNENLTLSELANKLEITDKKLSELLNQHLNTNFYNFINEYRVAEVKARLGEEKYKKYTLLSIAFDSGFQSKTSFNRVFKQKTGMSPSKYKKQMKLL